MKINLFKIKKEKEIEWKNWCNLLNTLHKEEAIETLKEEGLLYENCSMFKIGDDFYTLGLSEGDGKPANLNRELNKKHQEKKKECLDYVGEAEMLYEFYNKEKNF